MCLFGLFAGVFLPPSLRSVAICCVCGGFAVVLCWVVLFVGSGLSRCVGRWLVGVWGGCLFCCQQASGASALAQLSVARAGVEGV
jgi:hypothetical protein